MVNYEFYYYLSDVLCFNLYSLDYYRFFWFWSVFKIDFFSWLDFKIYIWFYDWFKNGMYLCLIIGYGLKVINKVRVMVMLWWWIFSGVE